ncbi:MAG: hypothetical protein KME45_09260 [Stenomitos rutilans HA7619-LM2]|nr:hypothetical protein [Stenomitos rutilans HA7619-LM2]
MVGQMCWLSRFGGGELILHLRLGLLQPWKPYTQFPHLAVPDYPIAGASKGFATSQKLLSTGWTLLSVTEAKAAFNRSQAA